MYLDAILYTYLNAQSDLTTLLDTYSDSSAAIFPDVQIPKDFTGTESVNFYNNQPVSGQDKIYIEYFAVNCRGANQVTSQAIAKKVHELLNRININSQSYCLTDILPTIQPENETDVFNTPVSLKFINKYGG